MTTTRLLRVSSNPQLNFLGSGSSASSSGVRCSAVNGDYEYQKKKVKNNGDEMKKNLQMGTTATTNTHHLLQVKPSMAAAASGSLIFITSEPKERIDGAIFDLVSSLSSKVNNAVLVLLREHFKRRSLKQNIQMFIERGILNCRFFALFAVVGSLLGSVLCFVEGCFLVLQSYFQYFHNLSHKADQGHVMHLLIEAIDMFMVGMAMLMFGFGLYTMFVGSKSVKEKGPCLAGSNLFGLFYMKSLPTWVEMQSVSQAKSKLGHAVMMILQVGVLEKFKSVPLVTGLDLACFAATVLISSACIFLLSKLSVTKVQD
ncbi:uncharacterized protein LOC133818296 [Humulus lupulus]|uniref:uncharacterized protein LOC133818296 n=1 Tax=Humulus lupulus TaxID=3486 RepID=UPI002B400CA5|nr:uncharacterized protein LOC133818296 [Humulus lupulus]